MLGCGVSVQEHEKDGAPGDGGVCVVDVDSSVREVRWLQVGVQLVSTRCGFQASRD